MGYVFVIAVVVFLVWYFAFRRKPTPTLEQEAIKEKMDALLKEAGVDYYMSGAKMMTERSHFRTVDQALESSRLELNKGDIEIARGYAGIAAYLAYKEYNFDKLVIAVTVLQPLTKM